MKGALALGAAVLCLAAGVVTVDEALAVLGRTWPILAFLVLVTLLAELCEEVGLFELAAGGVARAARGRRVVLFLLACGLAVVTTVALGLDTTAVLLTPVLLALAERAGMPPLPFAFAAVWLANAASLLTPVANLTNLLAQERLGLDGPRFVATMAPAQAAVLVVVLAVLLLRHRRALRGRFVLRAASPRRDDRVLLAVAGLAAGGVAVAVVAGVAAWVASLGGLLLLALACAVRAPELVRPRRLPRLVPLDTVAFALGLFVVVDGLAGLWAGPADALFGGRGGGALDALVVAGGAAVAANLVNNLPAYLALEPHATGGFALAAVLVGVDVGPVVLLWGSLANLLWRQRCRARGLDVRAGRFALEGLLVAVPAVTLGALVFAWTAP